MLSKSKFTRGIICPKSLWLYVNKREERLIDEATMSIFAQGTDVGELARQYFPGGRMAMLEDYPNFDSAKRTQELIRQGVETIYEATFVYNKTLVAVDILTKINGEWQLFEVKSTNGVKEQHIKDVAVQYYVVNGCGIHLKDASVMFFNRDYVRQGELDIQSLFTYQSILAEVLDVQTFVAENIEVLLKLEKQANEPLIEMGSQCTSPYNCDFTDYCLQLLPLQPEEKAMELSNEPLVNSDEIKAFLDDNPYPLYFFDFETIMPGVPMFDNSRPYQQIPFQYSLHYKENKGSELIHYEYLAKNEGDSRTELIRQLIENTQQPGYILVYNIAFERTRLKEMMRDFPQYAGELSAIIDRLVDLMPIFRRKHFVTESMQESYSIKYVLPALCPDLSYSELDINNGGDASAMFLALYEETDEEIIRKTRENLLK